MQFKWREAQFAEGYKIYIGKKNGEFNVVNGADCGTATSYKLAQAEYGTTYYWKVVPYNSVGDATDCPVWSFSTQADHSVSTFPWIETFDDESEEEALKVAACLEEHFPHSIANAVVAEAKKSGIRHEEMHTEVKYVVAHGIASEISGKRAVIGSYHFVFEDEKCSVDPSEEDRMNALPPQYSHLYLAIDGRLKAVICIFDPLREEAAEVVNALHGLGISKVCMMTGDNEKTAEAVAAALNIDEFHAEVLPEDKAAFIRKEHEKGRKVIMVGDGVNDTPALSEADVGVAISDGAAIAREIADVTIAADSLRELVILKSIANGLQKRTKSNYRFIIGFNGFLIALGIGGILPPATSAMLHNTSTVATGLKSMTDLLPESRIEDARERRLSAAGALPESRLEEA